MYLNCSLNGIEIIYICICLFLKICLVNFIGICRFFCFVDYEMFDLKLYVLVVRIFVV